MWVESLELENIRCFESATLRFNHGREEPFRWVNFVSENGGGKSTALQALALLLAGPEGAQQLLQRPVGWLRDESKTGKVSARIHQDEHDPGQFGDETVRKAFSYSYVLTGSQQLTVNNKTYTEPAIIPWGQSILTWLRNNAFTSRGAGWFAAGYGAFRRLTRESQIIVPSLTQPARFTNFLTQFDESALSAVEHWLVHLDYRIVKQDDPQAKAQKELGISAINRVLEPVGATFDSVTSEGRIMFHLGGQVVPTIGMSDGFRSILALAGDLIWRLILAFPDSRDALKEPGVVLIDELDIHLHPKWQREVASVLRETFPNLQFFVATHSPLIAAGSGDDALTLKFEQVDGSVSVRPVENVSALSVDKVLSSDAFNLVSPFSPETQRKIDRYDTLRRRRKPLSGSENREYQKLFEFMETARPIGGPPDPDSLDARIDAYLEKAVP